MPTPCSTRARTVPHGSTIMLSPKQSRPGRCSPTWSGATTKHPFSMALARSSTSQCAAPVCAVNAAGTQRIRAPRSASDV